MAFDPLNDDFLGWLVDATDSLDDWAEGLSQTEGFEDFIAYVRENGPQVAETVGALATALLDIVEAAAPLGGPVLAAVEGMPRRSPRSPTPTSVRRSLRLSRPSPP